MNLLRYRSVPSWLIWLIASTPPCQIKPTNVQFFFYVVSIFVYKQTERLIGALGTPTIESSQSTSPPRENVSKERDRRAKLSLARQLGGSTQAQHGRSLFRSLSPLYHLIPQLIPGLSRQCLIRYFLCPGMNTILPTNYSAFDGKFHSPRRHQM